MLYTVDIRFSNPDQEADWNAWYSAHLTEMVRVPGMTTAQRFLHSGHDANSYLAIYSVASPEVLESDAYRTIAGAGPRSKWSGFITRRRNLYAGVGSFPEIAPSSRLAISAAAPGEPADRPGVQRFSLTAVGLDRDPPHRSIAVVDAADAAMSGADVAFYAPLTDRRVAAAMQGSVR